MYTSCVYRTLSHLAAPTPLTKCKGEGTEFTSGYVLMLCSVPRGLCLGYNCQSKIMMNQSLQQNTFPRYQLMTAKGIIHITENYTQNSYIIYWFSNEAQVYNGQWLAVSHHSDMYTGKICWKVEENNLLFT